jgi:zinc protease
MTKPFHAGRAAESGIVAAELAVLGWTAAAAKRSWLESRMVSRSQDQGLMGTLGAREFWGRTMKWDEALEAKVSALTVQQVSDAFRRHIDPAALVVAKAGDFKQAGVLQ